MNPDPVVPDRTITPRVPPATSQTVHQAHRQPLGIHPVPLLGGLGAIGLLLAIVLLASGSLVAGLILLGVAVASLTLVSAGIRRESDAPGARPVLRIASRVRSLAGLITVAVRAWARAALHLIRIRGRQQRLRGRLKANLAPLGEAIHHDDQQRAQALKQQTAQLDQQLRQAQRDASAVITEARQRIERERSTIEPTQALAQPPAEQARAVHPPPQPARNSHTRQDHPHVPTPRPHRPATPPTEDLTPSEPRNGPPTRAGDHPRTAPRRS